jgi:hypothetical protein
MSRTVRGLILFLVFDAAVVGGYFLIRSMGSGKGPAGEKPWTTIDAAYAPRGAVEEFIKSDAAARDALPVEIRNYGRDAGVLGRFRGKQFARPSENVLSLFFKSLDDWTIVDIRYKNENDRQVQRTVLYVLADRQWRVGDTGTLIK